MCFVDLQEAMDEWLFDPDRISVRKIRSSDGSVKIQQRVELGIVQMHPSGRPDGQRPYGEDTLLEYHLGRLSEYELRNGTRMGFSLTTDDCRGLREEASLFYRRYVANFVLEDYERVVEDTAHNLEVFNLIRDHGTEGEDHQRLEGFRPYIIMMHTRALVHGALCEGHTTSAMAHINRGLLTLSEHFDGLGNMEEYEKSEEVGALVRMRTALADDLPIDRQDHLREKLQEAIDEERFEDAARLRDELNDEEFNDVHGELEQELEDTREKESPSG